MLGKNIVLKSMLNMIRLDTNYILRYLVNDNAKMAEIAEDAILNKNVYISNEVLAEVIYVLEGVYHVNKDEIVSVLLKLISQSNIAMQDKYFMGEVLEIFKIKNLDFVDCLLCVYSRVDEILTFDKKLQKCIG